MLLPEFIILIMTISGLFVWNRTEARSDSRHFASETSQLRREMIDLMRSIDVEMKDFHSRLCVIEERRKK
jgi:hypothetical protein